MFVININLHYLFFDVLYVAAVAWTHFILGEKNIFDW